MIFEHPRVLFLLPAVIPAFLVFKVNLKRYFHDSVSVFCKSEAEKRAFMRKMNARACFFALAWCLAVIGAAGPFIGMKSETVRKSGSEVIFAIDISRSMLVSDILPSRLDYAAACAKSVAAGLSGIPCGVVLIKGAGVSAVPLTLDYSSVFALLDSLSPNLLTSAGTDIAKGIEAAAASFSKDRDCAKFLILFTDGGEESSALSVAASRLREESISLIAVGTATKEGGEIDMYPGNAAEGRVNTALNEAALRRAATSAAGASFFINASESGVSETAERILLALPDGSADGFVLAAGAYPVNRRDAFFVLALLFFSAGIAAGQYYRKKDA